MPKLLLRLLMLLARLLGCLACQCLSEDELFMGLVFITGAFQSNTYVIIIMHGRSLFFFSPPSWMNAEG